MKWKLSLVFSLVTFFLFSAAQAKAGEVGTLVNKLFFHVNVNAPLATTLDLRTFDNQIVDGSMLGLRQVGIYREDNSIPSNQDNARGLVAAFADGSGNLLPPGANTNAPMVTAEIFEVPTDLTAPFSVRAQVPDGAVSIKLGANSSSFDDNDDGGDFGVILTSFAGATFTGVQGEVLEGQPTEFKVKDDIRFWGIGYTQVSNPEHGTAFVGGDGIIRYTPEPNFIGEDSFIVNVKETIDNANFNFSVNLSVVPNFCDPAVEDCSEVKSLRDRLTTEDLVPNNTECFNQNCSGLPVNVASGAMWHKVVDTSLQGRTANTSLNFERMYVARRTVAFGDLGANWQHNWETKLEIHPSTARPTIMWIDENGGPWIFRHGLNNTYSVPRGFRGSLIEFPDHYELTKQDKSVLTFDLDGKLIQKKDRHGEVVSLAYDTNGKLATISSPLAGSLSITRDTAGRIETVHRDRDNLTYTYTYDGSGRLSQVTDFTGLTEKYTYTPQGWMTSMIDKLGREYKFTYYLNGRTHQQFEPGGVRTFYYSPDGENLSTTVVDIDGTSTTYFFDTGMRTIAITKGDGTSISQTWNLQGFLESRTDELGKTTQFQYDANGNLSGVKRPLDADFSTITYDQTWNVPTLITPLVGAPTQLTLDPNTGDVLGVSRTDGATTLSLTYTRDAFGNLLSTNNGRTTYADVRDTNGLLTEKFDAHNPETIAYDARERVHTRTFASGRVLTYSYDDYDRVTQIADTNGPTIQTAYDAVGRVISKTITDGQKPQTTTYVWDGQDRLLSQTDALGRVTKYEYDEHRVLRNPSKVTDPAGRVTTFKYDVLGRMIEKKDPKGAVTTYSYDARGALAFVTDANGKTTTFEYDDNGRKNKEIRPSVAGTSEASHVIHYVYDPLDRVVVEQHDSLRGAHRVIQYVYDAFDRLITRTLSTGANLDDQANYTYEPQLDAMAMLTANNNVANLSFTPEAAPPFLNTSFGVLAAESGNPKGLIEDTFTIDRDVTGEISNISGVNQGQIYSKTYDAAGRLTAVNAEVLKTVLSYDGFGRKIAINHSNGTSGIYAYDQLNRIAGIEWKEKAHSSVFEYLQYDKAGNISSIQRENAHYKLSYDETDQLVKSKFEGQAGVPNYNRSFTYDFLGNRIASSANGSGSFTSNFLTANGVSSFLADPDGFGNVVRETTGRQVKNYIHRADSRVSGFQSGNLAVSYYYDGLDRPVAKAVNDNGNQYSQSFLYEGLSNRILQAKGGDGAITTYLEGQGPNEHLGESKNGVYKGYITDHLGSVLNSPLAGSSHQYGLFGESSASVSPSASGDPVVFGFMGHPYDVFSGTYETKSGRRYMPQTGRWNAQEPFGLDGPNPYRFVFNNPVRYADYNGFETTVVTTYDAGVGSHSALFTERDGRQFLYDPGGSFEKSMGSGRYTDAVSLQEYLDYQKSTGSKVETTKLNTTLTQEQQIQARAENAGDSGVFFCAKGVSDALGGTCGVKGSYFPGSLNDQAKKAKCP